MATKEELQEIFNKRREHYEKQCRLPQNGDVKMDLLRVHLDLNRMCAVLQTSCTERQLKRAEMYLKELDADPLKEPSNYLRYNGYY